MRPAGSRTPSFGSLAVVTQGGASRPPHTRAGDAAAGDVATVDADGLGDKADADRLGGTADAAVLAATVGGGGADGDGAQAPNSSVLIAASHASRCISVSSGSEPLPAGRAALVVRRVRLRIAAIDRERGRANVDDEARRPFQ